MVIDPNIKRSNTLPGAFYRSATTFETVKQKIFESSWHFIGDHDSIKQPGQYHPITLLPGVLDEPLLLTHDSNGLKHCLSNVCTHRGKIIVEAPGASRLLSCGYHGRCFNLDGSYKSMPAFKEVENFPSEADHLAQIPMQEWFQLVFVSLFPKVDFNTMIQPMMDLVGWLPFDTMRFEPDQSKDFEVKANWALYCDNYLEGFHIPFVHPSLNNAIVFDEYEYHTFDYMNLQLAIAKEGQPCFDIPPGAPNYGRAIYAYYFWLFPNVMFNIILM